MLQRLFFPNSYHFWEGRGWTPICSSRNFKLNKNGVFYGTEAGELKNIYFPRLWREYKKQTGHWFSCGKPCNHYSPCHFCKMNFIILEEMTHLCNVWTNWSNWVFISNSMPTIMTRGEIDTKFWSEIYTKCMAICEPMDFLGMSVNQWNIYRIEETITEPPIWACMLRTWNNMNAPLHYVAAVTRIRECKNWRSTAIPLLEELCLKNVFSILKEKIFERKP